MIDRSTFGAGQNLTNACTATLRGGATNEP
jgi:hypothetical protein